MIEQSIRETCSDRHEILILMHEACITGCTSYEKEKRVNVHGLLQR